MFPHCSNNPKRKRLSTRLNFLNRTEDAKLTSPSDKATARRRTSVAVLKYFAAASADIFLFINKTQIIKDIFSLWGITLGRKQETSSVCVIAHSTSVLSVEEIELFARIN